MNRRRLVRLERALASARETLQMPLTEEALRRLCLECLPQLTAEAFGCDDSHSSQDYLRGLSSQALLALYGQAMDTLTERSLRHPDAMLRWFQCLPVTDRIRLLTRGPLDWDWVQRQVRKFVAHEMP